MAVAAKPCPGMFIGMKLTANCPTCLHPATMHSIDNLSCVLCNIARDPEFVSIIAFEVLKLLAGGAGADTATS